MRSSQGTVTVAARGDLAAELVLKLDTVTPSRLVAGSRTAVFCAGSCFHRIEAVADLEMLADGARHRCTAFGMPRLDVLGAVRHARSPKACADAERADPESAALQARSYRSGFWATVPVGARAAGDTLHLRAAVRLADGSELLHDLARLDVVARSSSMSAQLTPDRSAAPMIAICMATFEPDLHLFRVQIESLRAQTCEQWVCLISDDCSNPERFAEIQRTVSGDPRFVVCGSQVRLGYYRNFERALMMVPEGTPLVALSDQDDYWYPEKLEALAGALDGAQLAYSDQRLVDAQGRVLRDTLWAGRHNNYRNLGSQVVANTIAGAAIMMRRELLELALPFPEAPGFLFHDHWLGMVAMASGEVAFVDRPLYDYVQHAGAVFGDVTYGQAGSITREASWWRRTVTPRRGWLDRWRAAYFYGYLPREVLARTVLLRCSAILTARKRRILERFVASDRSPGAFAWLALRTVRAAVGLNETLGSEADLVRGILWRWLIAIDSRRGAPPGRFAFDATTPDPAVFEQRRLRRWRASLVDPGA